MYSWKSVAQRTVVVYDKVASLPKANLADRLCRYASVGSFLAPLTVFTMTVIYLTSYLLKWWWPEEEVEVATDFPYEEYCSLGGPSAFKEWRVEALIPSATSTATNSGSSSSSSNSSSSRSSSSSVDANVSSVSTRGPDHAG